MKGFQLLDFERPGPKQLSFLPAIATGLQLAIGERRQKNGIAPDTRRGRGPGHSDTPQEICRSDLDRRLGFRCYAGSVGSAKLWPIGRGSGGRAVDERENQGGIGCSVEYP